MKFFKSLKTNNQKLNTNQTLGKKNAKGLFLSCLPTMAARLTYTHTFVYGFGFIFFRGEDFDDQCGDGKE